MNQNNGNINVSNGVMTSIVGLNLSSTPPPSLNTPLGQPSTTTSMLSNMSPSMVNQTLSQPSASNISLTPNTSNTVSGNNSSDVTKEIYPLVLQLTNPDQRENALLDLSKRRETLSDLAPILWYSYGTIAALLQEIISIYPMLSPPTLTAHASNRVCNALALLQCVASHAETKSKLMYAYIPLYLYPFLNTISRLRPFEYLRLTSLGVIGALIKMDDPEVVQFLLQTEIIPLCLRIMETGSELSKTVATFIVQKILLDDSGLNYVCATSERFYAVSTVLSTMVAKLLESPSTRLLKHIVRCYLRLSEHSRARDALKTCLPNEFKDSSFIAALRAEDAVQKWLVHLLKNINDRSGDPSPTVTASVTASSSQSFPASGLTSNGSGSVGLPPRPSNGVVGLQTFSAMATIPQVPVLNMASMQGTQSNNNMSNQNPLGPVPSRSWA